MERTVATTKHAEAGTTDGPAGLIDRARALAPFFERYGEANDDRAELADEVAAAIEREGLYGMWVPPALGGSGLDALRGLELIEELSRADASTGWVVMAVALAVATGAAYLADEAVAELFGGDRMPVIAGQGTFPNGRAVVQDGGFLLSGSWSYGSGVTHTTHLHSAGIVCDERGPRPGNHGGPEVRIFVTPTERATLGGNWDVLGLRATASVDYSMESVFVPAGFTHLAPTEAPLRGGNLFTMGIPGFAAICHSGWALGVGRRVIDELVAYAHTRANRAGALAESESFFESFAKAEAGYRAARAMVYETWQRNQETLDRGDRLSTRERTLAWLALNHATWTVAEVCRFAYTVAGGTSLRRSTLQRLFRDVHAGTQHVTSGPAILRACGRELAGFATGKAWFGLGQLVDPRSQ
jgi:alkylation response protein AidB-like acyl-CoA dehydrogenase